MLYIVRKRSTVDRAGPWWKPRPEVPKGYCKAFATVACLCAAMAGALPARADTPPDVLVIAHAIDGLATIDPARSFEFAGSDVIRNVYQKLVDFDPDDLGAGFRPALASGWETSDDGRTIVFTMAKGATFASGRPVTAEDAAFSLRRVVTLGKTPSFILTQFGFTAENVGGRIVADGDILTLVLDRPYATSFVLNCLGSTVGSIVDRASVLEHERDGDLGGAWLDTHSAGSGPYELLSWRPLESLSLGRNAEYAGEAPAMRQVVVRHVLQSSVQRLLLERGDVDVARDLDPDDVRGLRRADGVTVLAEPRGRLLYVSFNQKHPELSKPKVIEALKYLIDYEGMRDSFLDGQYVIHQSFLPDTYLGAIDDRPYALDVERAKGLLEEAGAGDGFSVEIGVRNSRDRIEIAQSLKDTFARAGVELEISLGTGRQVLTRYRARELDVALGAWGPDYPDPQTNAGTFAWNPDNSDEAGATGSLAYRNAWDPGELGPMVEAAVVEHDVDVRRGLYETIQRRFLEVAPFAIMYRQTEQVGLRENVEGLSLGGPVSAAAYWGVTKER